MGSGCKFLTKYSTLESRQPHILPGIVLTLAAAVVSEIDTLICFFIPSHYAHGPRQQRQATPQQHSSISATQIINPKHPLSLFLFLRLFAAIPPYPHFSRPLPKNILHPAPTSHTLHAVPSSLNLVNTWCCSRQDCRSFPGPRADETRLRTRCVAVIPAETHRGKAAIPPYISPNHTARKAAVIAMAAPVRCIPTDIVLHHGRPQ